MSSVSRPALGPTQPPVQWVRGGPLPGVKRGWGVTLTTHIIQCLGQEGVGAILLSPFFACVAVVEHLFTYMINHNFKVRPSASYVSATSSVCKGTDMYTRMLTNIL
jgi:hypothetical protein